jgi:hypothetical protein
MGQSKTRGDPVRPARGRAFAVAHLRLFLIFLFFTDHLRILHKKALVVRLKLPSPNSRLNWGHNFYGRNLNKNTTRFRICIEFRTKFDFLSITHIKDQYLRLEYSTLALSDPE